MVCNCFISVVLDGRPEDNGVSCAVFRVTAKCHRSMRKNEAPHDISSFITCFDDVHQSQAHHCVCSCAIGTSGNCGHIISLLYQLAEYKALGLNYIPDPLPSTSLPQQWHKPRGQKIAPAKVDQMQLSSPAAEVLKSRAVCSTAYNPVAGRDLPTFDNLVSSLKEVSPNSQLLTLHTVSSSASSTSSELVSDMVNVGPFGKCVKGSVLSYQQAIDPLHITCHPGLDFPGLPVKNVMCPSPLVLTQHRTAELEKLLVSTEQVALFEKETQQQSDSTLWHRLRKSRLTASKIGSICKRRSDFHKLCDQLKRNIRCTSAMKEGLLREPLAAAVYATIMDSHVNVYSCGLVISPYTPWIAASPDRKVFCSDRTPPFGLLEIKCPQSQNLDNVSCLAANEDKSGYKLKTNHDYYYQVQCQLAVTGLDWCDFLVYLENGDLHLETINFDCEFWRIAQQKVDNFFFNYFIFHAH